MGLIKPREAAARLNISRQAVYKALSAGTLKKHIVNGGTLVDESEISSYRKKPEVAHAATEETTTGQSVPEILDGPRILDIDNLSMREIAHQRAREQAGRPRISMLGKMKGIGLDSREIRAERDRDLEIEEANYLRRYGHK